MPKKEEHWGIVIDNRDPEKRGRLIVQADTIAEGDVLEWIDPTFHFVDSDTETKAGSLWIPNPGAVVAVEIEAEDDSEAMDLQPRWKCCIYPDDAVPDAFIENYPNRRGWVTRAGHILYFDDTEEQLYFYYEHPSGAKITVDNDGNIRLDTDASVYIGRGASHPITRGDVLENFLTSLKSWLDGHLHLPGTFTTPSGPVTGTSGTPASSSTSIPGDLNSDDHKVD